MKAMITYEEYILAEDDIEGPFEFKTEIECTSEELQEHIENNSNNIVSYDIIG